MVVMKAVVASALMFGAGAFGQCGNSVTHDLRAAFLEIGQPASNGEQQDPNVAWSFRRGDENGALLVGGNINSYGLWNSPQYLYSIPLLGPLMSPVSDSENQGLWDRRPSFRGLFAHPGNADVAEDLSAVLAVHGALTVTGLQVQAEVVGDISNGVVVTVYARKNGNTSVIAGPAAVFYTTSGNTIINANGGVLPLTLGAGDKVWVRVGNNGSPFEDWGNMNLVMTYSGAPIVTGEPRAVSICAGGEAHMTFVAQGSQSDAARWQQKQGVNFVDLSDGVLASGAAVSGSHTATLTITGVTEAEQTDYRCIVSNSCGSATSSAAALNVCSQDFDCDGFVTGADFDAYVTAFEEGNQHADYDGDGFITGVDFDLYVQSFEEGC